MFLAVFVYTTPVVKVSRSSGGGAHGTESSMEVWNLAHFMHKIAFFINSRGRAKTRAGGWALPSPLTLTTAQRKRLRLNGNRALRSRITASTLNSWYFFRSRLLSGLGLQLLAALHATEPCARWCKHHWRICCVRTVLSWVHGTIGSVPYRLTPVVTEDSPRPYVNPLQNMCTSWSIDHCMAA